MVDDPADKAGTIKARARRAAAPDIGITEIFLCFGNHLSEFFIRQSLARNVVILVFSAGTCAIRRCKGDACKQVIPIAPALQCDFVALQLVICEAGISGNIVHTPIEQRYIEDFILILYRHLIGVGVSGSGDRIIAIAHTGFFPCPDFYLFFQLQLILRFKNTLEPCLHLASRIVFKFYGQQRSKLIGIVTDFRQIVAILVIARMVSFNAVDLFAKFIFQLGIIRLHAFQIFIFRCIGSPQHHIAAAIDQDRAGRYRPGNHQNKQSHGCNPDDDMRVALHKLKRLFRHAGSTLRSFRRASCCVLRCGCTCLRSGILFFDSLLLPPSGKEIRASLRIRLHAFRKDGIHGIFICLFLQPLQLFVLPQLSTILEPGTGTGCTFR